VVTNAEDTLNDEDSKQVRVEHGIRYLIAGHPDGAVRRIILYGIVAVAVGAGSVSGIYAAIAIAALLLLALTDQYA
jgi:hypothetical protein